VLLLEDRVQGAQPDVRIDIAAEGHLERRDALAEEARRSLEAPARMLLRSRDQRGDRQFVDLPEIEDAESASQGPSTDLIRASEGAFAGAADELRERVGVVARELCRDVVHDTAPR